MPGRWNDDDPPDNVEKVYRTDRIETVALSDINLDVAEGEFVSIMGPSGCGKSTLLNLMGLLDVPTKGTCPLDGAPVDVLRDRRLARLRNREIGFVFQTFHLIPDLTRARQRGDPAALPADRRTPSAASWPSQALERVGLSVAPAPLPLAALGRPAAAGGHRARHRGATRACSWPTSPRATSTRRWATRSWRILQELNRETDHGGDGHPRPAPGGEDGPHRPPLRRPAGELSAAMLRNYLKARLQGPPRRQALLHRRQPLRHRLHPGGADGGRGHPRPRLRRHPPGDAGGADARRRT